jgi:hypothetical protein
MPRIVRQARSVVAFVGILSLSASGEAEFTSNAGAKNVERTLAPPPEVPFRVENEVGIWPWKNKLRAFVDNDLRAHVGTPKEFDVLKADGTYCKLAISPVQGAVEIPRQKVGDPAKTYVVAILTNPNDCQPKKLRFDKDDRLAWVIRFTNPSPTPNGSPSNMGEAHLVRLKNGFLSSDDYIGGGKGLPFWRCGHDRPINRTDNAMILKHGNVCDVTMRFNHDADAIRQALAAEALVPVRRPLTTHDDPSLWFACGGDCCYSDF